MPRLIATTLFAALATLCTAAQEKKDDAKGDNKLVGKWKGVSWTPKDGKEEALDDVGTPILEFNAEGTVKGAVDADSFPAKLKKELVKNKEEWAKLTELRQVAKYRLSGDMIEFLEVKEVNRGPFGPNNKGKLKFDGDTLTIAGDAGTLKLTRMKEPKKDDKKEPPEKK